MGLFQQPDVMIIPVRIYYEDTDCGGVVYYANYLKYFERGRTEFLRERGVSLEALAREGVVFVVRSVEAEYHGPCAYNDLVFIETGVRKTTGATVTFEHKIRKEGYHTPVVTGSAVLAAVGRDGRPMRLPEAIKKAIAAASKGGA